MDERLSSTTSGTNLMNWRLAKLRQRRLAPISGPTSDRCPSTTGPHHFVLVCAKFHDTHLSMAVTFDLWLDVSTTATWSTG